MRQFQKYDCCPLRNVNDGSRLFGPSTKIIGVCRCAKFVWIRPLEVFGFRLVNGKRFFQKYLLTRQLFTWYGMVWYCRV